MTALLSGWARSATAGGCASGRGRDHPRADSLVARLVDQDEAAGAAVAAIWVEHERDARSQAHAADVVERELRRRLGALERVYVDEVADLLHDRRRAARGVLDQVPPTRAQRLLRHPAHVRLERARHQI